MKNFNIGDKVIVPFYTACGECFYCVRGQASRCTKGELFGNSAPANTIDGGQAEYVRCPLADSTFVKKPDGIPEEMLVLMADIFPTGYFAASRFLKDLPDRDRKEFTVAVIGCGPVGICAITCALTMVDKVIAIDSMDDRLQEAKKIGADVVNLNDDPIAYVKKASEGRGADVVIECVGHTDAWELAFDMIRPFGQISSIGVQYVSFSHMSSFVLVANVVPARKNLKSTACFSTGRTSPWHSVAVPFVAFSRMPSRFLSQNRRKSLSFVARPCH